MPRILLIEGEPDLAAFMAIALRSAGHQVDIAGDGATALQFLRTSPPDLVVLEILLPDIVGLSLCENLRRNDHPEAPRIPVLVTSACNEAEVRPLALAAGADDYLPKPFSPYQLLLRVHALLKDAPQCLAS